MPATPAAGDMEVTVAGIPKVLVLLARPLTVTTTGPELAPTVTGNVMLPLLQLETTPALTLLNVTVLPPWLAPNPLPVIVTEVPTAPELGDR